MPRSVGNDELSLGRGKIAISHIDRDPLLTLGFQTIRQQRGIKITARGSVNRRSLFNGSELILVDHFGIVKQAADQCALAIVNAATGNESQQLFTLMLSEIFVNICGNQVGMV